MSERIVIDPEDLRRMAARMRGAALLLSSTGRDLGSRGLPPMPSAVAALVAESLARVNSEVQDLAAGLVRDTGNLLARATWAEIGGDAPPGWLPHDPSGSAVEAMEGVDTPLQVSALSGEQVARAEAWAIEQVESAAAGSMDDDASALRHTVVQEFSGPFDGVQQPPLGSLTLAAPGAPEFGDAALIAGPVPSPGAGGGALGNALREIASTSPGAGILGCLAVGTGIDAAEWAGGESS